MEPLIRNCYKEMDIKNVNSVIFSKRINAIDNILKDDTFEKDNWGILTKWLINIDTDNDEVEEILIELEKKFCKEDTEFSKDNSKEMRVLTQILIYSYCEQNNEMRIPLIILCGSNIGYKLESKKISSLFDGLIRDWRLEQRGNEQNEVSIKSLRVKELQNKITKEKKELEDNISAFQYSTDKFDSMLKMLETCEKNFLDMQKREEYLLNELEIQREESDILWWTISEWSNIYCTSIKNLFNYEAAIVVPIELSKLTKFDLGPYALKQIIYKVMSLSKDEEQNITLTNIVDSIRDEIYDVIEVETLEIDEVQPILLAIKSKYESRKSPDVDAWKTVFFAKSNKTPDEIQMNVFDFAYQLYLELELANLFNE